MKEIARKLWNKNIGYKVDSVAVSKEGEYVVAGSSQDTQLYFLTHGQIRWKYKTKASIRALTISEDGRYILAGTEDGNLYLLDRTANLIWEEYVSTNSVFISSDLKYIAIGSNDCNVYFFTRYGKLLWKWSTSDYVNAVAIASQNNLVVASGDDRNLYFLTKEGTLLWRTRLKECGIKVTISRDGDYIIVACNNQMIYCFDYKCRLRWEYHFHDVISGLSMTEDAHSIIIASPWQNFHILNRKGKQTYFHETNFGIISLFSTSSGYLVLGSSDKQVYLFKCNFEAIKEPESSLEILMKEVLKQQTQILQQYPMEVVIMITQIQGYTPFVGEEDDIRKKKLENYTTILSSIIKEASGCIVTRVQDACLSIFPDPVKAVESGCKIQKEFMKYNENKSLDEEICVQMGMSWGELKIEKDDQLVKPFLITSGIVPYSEKGQLLVTKDLCLLIEGKLLVEAERVGAKEIKGVEKLIPVYKIKELSYTEIGWYNVG